MYGMNVYLTRGEKRVTMRRDFHMVSSVLISPEITIARVK